MRGLELFFNIEISDTLRDRLLNMEKLKFINNKEIWLELRLLRNKITHAYFPDGIKEVYESISKKSKNIFNFIENIELFIDRDFSIT